MSERKYPAKVLLFGEYSILLGGNGLSQPFHFYSGSWDTSKDQEGALSDLVEPLKELELEAELDHEKVEAELSGPSYFASSIPIGKGLGSSGALTAALYDRFADHQQLTRPQKFADLGRIEGSLFHERSSGFDALVSLEDCDFQLVGGRAKEIERPQDQGFFIYLLDSGLTRSTAPLVAEFTQRMQNKEFGSCMERIASINDNLIGSYLSGTEYWDLMDALSRAQLATMSFCIPKNLALLWLESLQKNELRIKLCGAGGGGFYLVFSQTRLDHDHLADFPIIPYEMRSSNIPNIL